MQHPEIVGMNEQQARVNRIAKALGDGFPRRRLREARRAPKQEKRAAQDYLH
jgi:hypothetical protein